MLALALALTALSFAQALHRARQGRCALLKWRPDVETLAAGGAPYGYDPATGAEGFPLPPLGALLLRPFLALGDTPAALAWAALKLGLAWWCLASALGMAAGRARDFPPWAALAVVLLCARSIASDVAHGNVNLLLAAVLVAAALDWRAGRELRAGTWIALGAMVKATPLLFVLYFVRKRSSAALAGVALGLVAFAFALPGALLGWERNLELLAGWWRQMALPYLGGTRLDLTQTEHINQSLLGVLARLFTDAVAIPARPPALAEDVQVNVLELSRGSLRALHLAACVAVLAFVAWSARASRAARATATTLGEWALVALAMLMLSERSWKQHYVTLFLPVAYLAWHAARPGSPRGMRQLALAALALGALLPALSGSGVLGDVGSDLAEAYGVFLWGALVLLAACGRLVRSEAPLAEG